MSSVWDNAALLDVFEAKRAAKQEHYRKSRNRLSFDCYNLICIDDRAVCNKGKTLGKALDGSMSLIAVLRGVTASICRNCEEFNGDEA